MPVIIRKDRTKDVYAAIRSLTSKEVLIGIPAAAGDHKTPEGGQTSISKAAIGYILETGSPARNLPARPFLAPGVASYQDRAAKRLKTIGRKALDGDTRQIDQGLAAVGQQGLPKGLVGDPKGDACDGRTIARSCQQAQVPGPDLGDIDQPVVGESEHRLGIGGPEWTRRLDGLDHFLARAAGGEGGVDKKRLLGPRLRDGIRQPLFQKGAKIAKAVSIDGDARSHSVAPALGQHASVNRRSDRLAEIDTGYGPT